MWLLQAITLLKKSKSIDNIILTLKLRRDLTSYYVAK
jgi:hypothetical protein